MSLKTLPLKNAGSAVPQALAASSTPTFAGMKLSAPGTGAGTAIVRDGSGNLLDLVSHRDAKEFIEPLTDCWSILGLQGSKFRYKGDLVDSFGFIADEVAAINSQWVIYVDGKPYSVPYHFFIPYIVECLKDLKASPVIAQSSTPAEVIAPEVTEADLQAVKVDILTLSRSIDLVRDMHKADHDAIVGLKDRLGSLAKMHKDLTDEVSVLQNQKPETIEFPMPEKPSQLLPVLAILVSTVAIVMHWL